MTRAPNDPVAMLADLGLSTPLLSALVLHARAYDAKEALSDPDSGSNPADDRSVDVLQMDEDDLTLAELRGVIEGLSAPARRALTALVWLGRGDFEPEEWSLALKTAEEREFGAAAEYLLGDPLLGDLIEEGAARLGICLSREEAEQIFRGESSP